MIYSVAIYIIVVEKVCRCFIEGEVYAKMNIQSLPPHPSDDGKSGEVS